jgi:hypothetical protein
MPKFESWREGAAVRKATRQARPDDAPKTRGVPNRRNTKLWCRGKVGVKHVVKVGTYSDLKNWNGRAGSVNLSDAFHGWLVQYCSECGKELQRYVPPFSSHYAKPIPDWAEAYLVEHPECRRMPR